MVHKIYMIGQKAQILKFVDEFINEKEVKNNKEFEETDVYFDDNYDPYKTLGYIEIDIYFVATYILDGLCVQYPSLFIYAKIQDAYSEDVHIYKALGPCSTEESFQCDSIDDEHQNFIQMVRHQKLSEDLGIE